jgi:hypothetical protein
MSALDGDGVVTGVFAIADEEDKYAVAVVIDLSHSLDRPLDVAENTLCLFTIGRVHTRKVGDFQDANPIARGNMRAISICE